MEVRFTHEARGEFNAMPAAEKVAMRRVVDLLGESAGALGNPYASAVKGADRLRELRPRAGRSAWRGFYRRIGGIVWMGSFGAEALANPIGFRQAVAAAVDRLNQIERKVGDD